MMPMFGLQSERSSDANKLTLCSALRPAQTSAVCICLWSTFHLGLQRNGSQVAKTGLMLTDFNLMSGDEALCCVAAFFHHEWQRSAFIIYTGLLFESSLAVTSFNRYSRFVEVLSRRFAFGLTCLHFDDAPLTDRKILQRFQVNEPCKTLNTLLRILFFRGENARRLQSSGTFFGIRSRISFKFLLRAPFCFLGARAH